MFFFLENVENNYDESTLISDFNENIYLYESEYKDLLIESMISEFKMYNEGALSNVWNAIKKFFEKIIKMVKDFFSKIKNLFKKSNDKPNKLKNLLTKAQKRLSKIGSPVITYTGIGFKDTSLFDPKGEKLFEDEMKPVAMEYAQLETQLKQFENSNDPNMSIDSMSKLHTKIANSLDGLKNNLRLNNYSLQSPTDIDEFMVRGFEVLKNKDSQENARKFIDDLNKTKNEAQNGIAAINKLPKNEITEEQKSEIKIKNNLVKAYQYKISIASRMYSIHETSRNAMMKSIEEVANKILKFPKP